MVIAKWKQWELPSSFGLTGRVHKEECGESFLVFLFKKQRMVSVFFMLKKRMESKEVIKRKIKNLEKALEKVIFKKLEDWFVVFNIGKRSGLTILLLNDMFFSWNSQCLNLIIGKNLSLSFESFKQSK